MQIEMTREKKINTTLLLRNKADNEQINSKR